MKIVTAEKSDLDSFFIYLQRQLEENGTDDSPLFQPVSSALRKLSQTNKDNFSQGFSFNLNELGWRKLWLVKNDFGAIKGHVDLRHSNEKNSNHRVLLGMGVDRRCRKQGLGIKLIDTAVQFCQNQTSIDWLDLCVLSQNKPAKNLYLKCGFSILGETIDLYRIDGKSVAEISMTMQIKK